MLGPSQQERFGKYRSRQPAAYGPNIRNNDDVRSSGPVDPHPSTIAMYPRTERTELLSNRPRQTEQASHMYMFLNDALEVQQSQSNAMASNIQRFRGRSEIFDEDPAEIQEMDMVSLKRELSRCYKALVTLQSQSGIHNHIMDLEGEIRVLRNELISAGKEIGTKDTMIVDLAQAANEMSQCSQKQLTSILNLQHKNSIKIQDSVASMSSQLEQIEDVHHQLAAKLRLIVSGQYEQHTCELKTWIGPDAAAENEVTFLNGEIRSLHESQRF